MRKKLQLTRREMEQFESYLRYDEREPATINAMLAAVNKFFVCMGREDCKVKYLKLQR